MFAALVVSHHLRDILFKKLQQYICRLKAYIVFTFGVRKINLPEISPAKRNRSIPNSVYVDRSRGDNVQEILGAISSFLAKWAGTSPAEPEFFLCGNPDDLLATSQRPIFTKFGHETYFGVSSMNPERHFRKFSL